MSISYSYEIINVNPQARAMEIVYTAPGRQTMHIGARMPYAGETVEQIVRMYEPVAYWREQDAQLAEVAVGTSGSIAAPEPEPVTLATVKRDKLAELAEFRYAKETSGVVFGGARIRTDRESQATVTGAYASIRDGILQSIDFKAANGVWVTLGLPEITAVAQAVAAHVQSCFTQEKVLTDQINAATTIEAVQVITIPWSEVGPQIPVVEV